MNSKKILKVFLSLFDKYYKLFFALLILGFPLLIHTFFKIEVSDDKWTVAVWKPEHILSYGSSIISSLIVYFTVILTIQKNKEENDRTLQNSQLEKKFEKFTEYSSDIISMIPYLNGEQIDKLRTGNFESIEQAKQELLNNFTNLQLKINSLQLYIPYYMRFYFQDKFMTNYESLKNDFFLILHNYESDYDIIRKQCNDFVKHKDSFLTITQQYFLLLSDYYFNEEEFKVQIKNSVKSYLIDEKFENYKIIKAR